MRAVWWTWGLFHKLTDFSQKWSWLGGGDESCRWDINNHNIVATLILERLRDPKNVIVSQGYDHFFWNWCCADFCGCCSHWFFSLNGTTSMGKKKKKNLASVRMLKESTVLNTTVDCFLASSQYQEPWALGKWKSPWLQMWRDE